MPIDAVLMMALGGPDSMDEVRPFIRSVLGGRPVPPHRFDEVVRHYEVVGGRSPLTDLTRAQAKALEARLAADGRHTPVVVGMRCWSPWLVDAMRELVARRVGTVAALIMSTHRDAYSTAQYQQALARAARDAGAEDLVFRDVPRWHDQPLYVDALADRVRVTAEATAGIDREVTPLLFSSHSIPRSGPDAEAYAQAIHATSRRVAESLGWRSWRVVYQSRTGRPEEPWLEPDVCSVIRDLARQGHRSVLLACPGFVCDHVEVLYDLDVEAADVAREHGMIVARAPTVGTHPTFIELLAERVRRAETDE